MNIYPFCLNIGAKYNMISNRDNQQGAWTIHILLQSQIQKKNVSEALKVPVKSVNDCLTFHVMQNREIPVLKKYNTFPEFSHLKYNRKMT